MIGSEQSKKTPINFLSFWARISIQYAEDFSNKRVAYFLRAFSLLQSLSLILTNVELGASVDINLSFRRVRDFVAFPFFTKTFENFSSTICGLGILTLYFSFLMGVSFFHFSLAFKNTSRFKCTRLSSILTNIHMEILFYPINLFLMRQIINTSNDLLNSTLLGREVSICLAIILLVFNFLITFFKLLFCYSPIRSKRFNCRKNSLHLLGINFIKVFLVILQAISIDRYSDSNAQESSKFGQIACVIISIIISGSCLITTDLTLPEYRTIFLKEQIIYDALATGISACQLVSIFFVDKEFVLKTTFLLIPFWIALRIKSSEERIIKLLFKNGHYKSAASEVAHLENIFKSLKDDLALIPYKKAFSIQTFRIKWLVSHQFRTTDSEANLQNISNEAKNFKELSKMFAKKSYEELLETKNNNCLALLGYCNLIISHFHMYPKAYHLCLKLNKERLGPPFQIALFEMISKINESLKHITQEESSSLMLVNIFDEIFENFKIHLHKYMKNAIEFWRTLCSTKPNIQLIYQKAKESQSEAAKLQEIWDKNSHKICKTHPISYLLYGILKSELLNLPHYGQIFIEKFEYIQENKFNHVNSGLNETSNSATIIMSGEKQHLGKILDCTKSVIDLFGFKKGDLVGKNIKTIMPLFFQDKHDQFLIKYHETGQSKLLNNTYKIYAKDKTNNVFPISLEVSMHFDEQKGIMYSGLIKKIVDSNEYILLSSDKIIHETSNGIRKQLGIEPYSNISILDIFPDFTSVEDVSHNHDLVSNSNEIHSNSSTFFQSFKQGASICLKPPAKGFKSTKPKVQLNYRAQLQTLKFQQTILSIIILKSCRNSLIEQNITLAPKTELTKDSSISDVQNGDEESSDETNSENLKATDGMEKYRLPVESLEAEKKPFNERKSIFSSARKLIKEESQKVTISQKTSKKEFFNYFKNPRFSTASLSSTGSSKSHKRQAIDNLQTIYAGSIPDRLRKILTIVFGCLLAASLVTSGIEHIVFGKAVKDIDLSVDVINTSYERLDALIFCWRFVLVYQTRIDKMYPTIISDLDRYKLIVTSYKQVMKNSNNDLLRIMDSAEKKDQEALFDKNIELILEENNDLKTLKLNNFESFNVLVEQLSIFGSKTHTTLLKGDNPEISFILKNSVNDMLIASEQVVGLFMNNLDEVVKNQKVTLKLIIFLNIVLMLIAGLIVSYNFVKSNSKYKNLFNALITISFEDIDRVLEKLMAFDKALKEKEENLMIRQLRKVCSVSNDQAKEWKKDKQFSRRYDYTKIFRVRLRQTAFLLVLISCMMGIHFYRFATKTDSFEELVLTNNRLVTVSKSRYTYNLAIGSLQYLLAFQNTTFMRNQPIFQQIRPNLNEIISNQYLTDTFMDSRTNKFIDPFIEMLFKDKLCPYLPEFPGSVMRTNCLKATQNETIGLYAVNMKYYEELDSYFRDFQRNSSYAKAKILLSDLITITVPKFYVSVGTYIVLIDRMSKNFKSQVLFFQEDSLESFLWQFGLILFLAIVCVWYLIKKANSDDLIRTLLKMIPYEEIIKNKRLKNVVIKFYTHKLDYLKRI